MKSGFRYFSRKIHRYLGIFIGIQFLLWAVGGFYFSWMNIHEIRGEHLQKEKTGMPLPETIVPAGEVLSRIKSTDGAGELQKFQIIEILQKPYYEIVYLNGKNERKILLVDAVSGNARGEIEKTEAQTIAQNALKTEAAVKEIEYLTPGSVSAHHEYREKPLPAFAVTFEKPSGLTVYVAAGNGRVEAVRSNEWRVFDFLWMLHTMGFADRDDINNYLLRGFSVLGILTVVSGFLLFFVSSPVIYRRRKKL